jgi:hypothetical protein
MPRSSRTGTPEPADTEIERTFRKLRKQAKLRKKQPDSESSSSTPPVKNIWEDIHLSSETETDTDTDTETQSQIPDTPETPSPSQIQENLQPTSPKSVTIADQGDNTEPTRPESPQPIHNMGDPERTLRQLVTRNVTVADFELKSGLIHLLPTFRGLENEDPYKFLKEFHVVCVGMKPHGNNITDDTIKL